LKDKPTASLSLDLDDLWVYLRARAQSEWRDFPSYLGRFVPLIVDFLETRGLTATVFVVGRDAALERNAESLGRLVEAGHEIGNHSFSHDPGMRRYDEPKAEEEIASAEREIERVTGRRPAGFRGPGFATSPAIARVLLRRSYQYESSALPSVLGPLARFYFFRGASLSPRERKERADLFGARGAGWGTIKPFERREGGRSLLSVPIATVPILRLPFHFFYLLWLARFSESLAMGYLRFALGLCRLRGVEPVLLMHPLDFLGGEDAPKLVSFPGMDLSGERKRFLVARLLDCVEKRFEVVCLAERVRRLSERGGLRSFGPGER
jgi:hypothetical protein